MAKEELKILTEDQLGWLEEGVLNSDPLEQISKRLGFNSKRSFSCTIRHDKEAKQRFEQAKRDACVYIEDDILHLNRICKGDHKLARILLSAKLKYLEFCDPDKYRPKMDVNLNQNISIRTNITAANDRLISFLKDVTHTQQVEQIQQIRTLDENIKAKTD